jgi:hypothetical protein
MRGPDMTTPIDPPAPEEFAALARAAGIALPAAEMPELQRGYASLLPWIARLREDWPYADEPAHQFASGREVSGGPA